jgi:heat-inducible transcriptional repressor
MSDLEEAGLITHPHTSAGRIPTEKGYRYYIDRLMQVKLLTEEEKKNINREFKARVKELDDVLEKASGILSSVTHQTGIVLFPLLQQTLFKHVEFVKLGRRKLLMVLMTESGFAKDFAIDIDDDIEHSELLRISNFINSHIDKGSLNKIRRDIMQGLLAEKDSFFYVLEKAKELIDLMLEVASEDKVYLDGRFHIADQPEFSNIERLKRIYHILENEDLILPLLKKGVDEQGIHVYVGSELSDELSDCSLIMRNYHVGEGCCGALGVIGPMRMEYAKLVSMVDYIASTLSRILSENNA